MEITLWEAFCKCFVLILILIYDVLVFVGGTDFFFVGGDYTKRYLKKFFPKLYDKNFVRGICYISFAILLIAIVSIWITSCFFMAMLQYKFLFNEVTVDTFIKKALSYAFWNILPSILLSIDVKLFGKRESFETHRGGYKTPGVRPGPKPRMTNIKVEPSTIMPPKRGIGTNPPPKTPRPPLPGKTSTSAESYRKENEKEVD